MVSKLDSYVIARFAQWALDNEYYEKMINQFYAAQDDNQDLDSAPDALPISAIDFMLTTRKKERISKRHVLSKKSLDINEKKSEWQPHFIVLPHMRGTIWRNSEISFVLKAYLTDLEFEEELRKNVQHFVNIERNDVSNFIDYWEKTEDFCFNVKMNEMALLEIFIYSCNPEWRKESEGIRKFFDKIMENFDPKNSPIERT
jgi:hypothetical protein